MTGSASTMTFGKPLATKAEHVTENEENSERTSAQTMTYGGRTACASEQARTEPHFDNGSGTLRQVDHEALQQQYAFYSQFNSPPLRSRPRWTYVIGVFAIGTVVGLAIASWLKPPLEAALENGLLHAAHNLRASPVEGSHGGTVKGINPLELPYDGMPPIVNEQGTPASHSDIATYDLPRSTLLSTKSEAQTGSSASTQRVATSQAAVEQKPARTPSTAPSIPKKHATMKAPRKRPVHRRVVKDKEIERIKQQAAEELKKKAENRQALESTGLASHRLLRRHDAPTVIDKSTRTRAMLANCEHARNFFLREKCKWRLCGGSWGQNGCPSYQMQASPY